MHVALHLAVIVFYELWRKVLLRNMAQGKSSLLL